MNKRKPVKVQNPAYVLLILLLLIIVMHAYKISKEKHNNVKTEIGVQPA